MKNNHTTFYSIFEDISYPEYLKLRKFFNMPLTKDQLVILNKYLQKKAKEKR